MESKFNICFDDVIPKYYQIEKHVKALIDEGKIDVGYQLPREDVMADRLGLNRLTVNKAMSNLVKEGLLFRKRGQGTFVAKPKSAFHAHQMVGMAMRTSGHVYSRIYSRIIENLQDYEYYCVAVNFSNSNEHSKKIRLLVEKNPEFILIDGYAHFPFEILENFSGKIIFVRRLDGEISYNAARVLVDFYKMGSKVAHYFLSMGYRRIIYLSHEIGEKEESTKLLIEGAKDALEEHGLARDDFVLCQHKYDENKIVAMLNAEKKPMALFCCEDNIAKNVYLYAKKLGLSIPGDISVIGCYDTPWAEALAPDLTSVSINEEEIADIVSEKIINGKYEPDRILVDPRIVFRGSVRKKET